MSQFRLVFRVHAIQRMFQRGVSEEEVKQVVAGGETIETIRMISLFPADSCSAGAVPVRCMWW